MQPLSVASGTFIECMQTKRSEMSGYRCMDECCKPLRMGSYFNLKCNIIVGHANVTYKEHLNAQSPLYLSIFSQAQ